MPYPPNWTKFCQWKRENGIDTLPENISLAELNRFAARYRLATSFQGIEIHGYPSATIQGYSAVVGAFLAYSTLEQLHKAAKPIKPKQHLNER
ncbi:MAG: hypothetical protein AAFY78_16915 [Cyanobacteria bacterium J06648_16]